MSNLTTRELLEKAENAFKTVRTNVLVAAATLYQVRETNAWEGKYSTYNEFVESGCGISQSFASKLLKAHEYWVINASFSAKELQDIPAESLYLAIGLSGNDEVKLEKARSLTRNELREELSVKENGEEHDHKWIEICTVCSKRNV